MNTDRRFLNYKEYLNFLRDLIDGKISEDSIIFIQDKRCIWARGKEYTGNLILDYDRDTKIAALKTADGESIVSFVDKDEYTGFKSQFINFVNAEYLPFKNNVYTQFTISTQNALSDLDNRVDGLRQQLETVSANIPTMEACSEDTFNLLETNGAVRNDTCYFIFKES